MYNNLDFCFFLKSDSFKLFFGMEATISILICLSIIAFTYSLTFFLCLKPNSTSFSLNIITSLVLLTCCSLISTIELGAFKADNKLTFFEFWSPLVSSEDDFFCNFFLKSSDFSDSVICFFF